MVSRNSNLEFLIFTIVLDGIQKIMMLMYSKKNYYVSRLSSLEIIGNIFHLIYTFERKMRYVCWSPHGFTNFLSIVEKVMKVLYSEFVKPMSEQLKFTLYTSTLYFLS